MIDPTYKIDTRVIAYREPATEVARFAQLPAYQMTPEAFSAAYMKDWRDDRRRKSP